MVTTPCPLPPLDPDRARIHPLADYIPPVDGGGNFGPVSVSATARKLH